MHPGNVVITDVHEDSLMPHDDCTKSIFSISEQMTMPKKQLHKYLTSLTFFFIHYISLHMTGIDGVVF